MNDTHQPDDAQEPEDCHSPDCHSPDCHSPDGTRATDGLADRPNGADADPVRRRLMEACAAAYIEELQAGVALLDDDACGVEVLRAPETGLIMLRGRIGGSGAPFNVGEASVTRAVVRLADGTVGYGYQLGRSHDRARLAAMIDAFGQDRNRRDVLETGFITPVMRRRQADDEARQAEAAATKVDFFTMMRGED